MPKWIVLAAKFDFKSTLGNLVFFNLINLVKIFVHVIMEKRSKAIEAFAKALNPTTGGSAVYVYLIKYS